MLVPLWLLLSSLIAQAHAPDTSYLRVEVSRHALTLRFSLDLSTLHRVVRIDADNDAKVTRREMEVASEAITAFLRQRVTLELNGTASDLGTMQSLGWPVHADEAMEEKDYSQTLVHFTFTQSSPRLIEDLYVLCEVFPHLGNSHRILADFAQEGRHHEVIFTQLEPDYLYDTFWREQIEPSLKSDFRLGVSRAWGNWVMLLVMTSLLLRTRHIRPFAVAAAVIGLATLGAVCVPEMALLVPGELHRVSRLLAQLAGGFVGFAIMALTLSRLTIIVPSWRQGNDRSGGGGQGHR